MAARQVLDGVWMVGSGTDETASTDPYDCHCYLVWDGTGGFLVDAGTGRAAERWLANVREVCDPASLGGVLLTHYHADHSGGGAAAARAGLTLLAHRTTAGAVQEADEERTQLRRAREAGIYPADYHLAAAPVQTIEDGQRPVSGGVSVEVIDAPGHCDGHLVFRVTVAGREVLLSGDCVFAGGRVSMQAIPDCRLDAYADTIVKLAALGTDALLPGHGELVLDGANSGLADAAASFRRLVPPPNLL
jgi:glyoxylase-like metal-dependent hydrolase (beta-lactamase superfamily II)